MTMQEALLDSMEKAYGQLQGKIVILAVDTRDMSITPLRKCRSRLRLCRIITPDNLQSMRTMLVLEHCGLRPHPQTSKVALASAPVSMLLSF